MEAWKNLVTILENWGRQWLLILSVYDADLLSDLGLPRSKNGSVLILEFQDELRNRDMFVET